MRWLRVRWELSREARRIARVGRLRLPVGLPVLLGAALPLAVPAALYALQDSRIVWTVRPDLERSLVELRGVVERAALAGDSRFAVHFRDAPPEGVRRLVASAGGREVTVRGSGHDRGRFLVEGRPVGSPSFFEPWSTRPTILPVGG